VIGRGILLEVDMCLAVPGQIKEIITGGGLRMAKVDFGGVLREVCIETLPEAKVGDYTIVHAGFALNLLSPEEAKETLDLLDQLAQYEEPITDEFSESTLA
jgi:hydrogenase expression/formation protein HypC